MESTSAQPARLTPASTTKALKNRDETLETAARPANFAVIAALQIRLAMCLARRIPSPYAPLRRKVGSSLNHAFAWGQG
jgi:hypothetical protein